MRRFIQLWKVKILKIKWFLGLIVYARRHHKEVENYEFLIETKDRAIKRKLFLEKNGRNDIQINRLNAQIELLDKIINFTKK